MTGNTGSVQDESGREHDERRKAQAAAARKHRLRNRFNKATRKAWRKDVPDVRS